MAKDNTGRWPDYQLRVKRKDGEGASVQIGAAWKINGGGISIQLNPGACLRWDDELWVSLFVPMTEEEKRARWGGGKKPADEAPPPPKDDEGEIPF